MTIVAIGTETQTPGLLVSVRNAEEAQAAVAGGAEVIDIKEPTYGPLGAADRATVAAVIDAVAGRRPVTVALGELADEPPVELAEPGVSVVKVGLAGSLELPWRDRLNELRRRLPSGIEMAAAAYLDHEQAGSPTPLELLRDTIAASCRWLVLDTWNKAAGTSLGWLSTKDLTALIAHARENAVRVVLAGGLGAEQFSEAVGCHPNLIGVRGAACEGGRAGRITEVRVRSLAQRLGGCRSNQ